MGLIFSFDVYAEHIDLYVTFAGNFSTQLDAYLDVFLRVTKGAHAVHNFAVGDYVVQNLHRLMAVFRMVLKSVVLCFQQSAVLLCFQQSAVVLCLQ